MRVYDIAVSGDGTGLWLIVKAEEEKPWTLVAPLEITLRAAREMCDKLNAPPIAEVLQDPNPTSPGTLTPELAEEMRDIANVFEGNPEQAEEEMLFEGWKPASDTAD